MRLAHLADLHLGFRQFQRQDPSGINQREADVAEAFRVAVDRLIALQPDAVVVAGDLFHSVRPTNLAILHAFTQLRRLRQELPRAPLILIAGNHDTPRSVETGSILKLFSALGADVADHDARRLVYPEHDLAVYAVPHAAVLGRRPQLLPDGAARRNVLAVHGELTGLFPAGEAADYGGARLELDDLHSAEWDYVALGHYHVCAQVSPRAWYSGSLEYTSPNVWTELREEAARGVGKGFLIADLDAGTVERVALPPRRRVLDLPWLDAEGLAAKEVDASIAGRLAAVPGGLEGAVVRLVVLNVPTATGRQLDHRALREAKAAALHLALDLRRPESRREVGTGGPARRQRLPDLLADFLSRRPLDADLDRDRLVALGRHYLDEVEQALGPEGSRQRPERGG